jgi:protein ImuB
LTVLFGVDRVGTPVLDETHRPDTFHIEPFRWQAVEAAVLSGELSDALTTAHTTVALRRFRPAISASVFLSENIPAHLRSTNVNGKVAEQRGPYLASGNWWDETAWARAEWDLQLENEVLLRCHRRGEKWEVDGIYD